MKRFLVALQFLTILPVKIREKVENEDLGRSLLYFPVVGLIAGLLLAGVAYITAYLPPLARSALVLTTWVLLTGALHLDGFADTCDGFYGNRSREDILRIMRDSRIGTMGAAGIALLLLFKFAILSSIRPDSLWKVLIVAPVFARWSQALACSVSGYARTDGKAGHFIKYTNKIDIFAGALFTLVLSWLLMGLSGIILFTCSSAAALLFIQYAKRKIGGMTGDTIGATNEIAEASALLFSLILLG